MAGTVYVLLQFEAAARGSPSRLRLVALHVEDLALLVDDLDAALLSGHNTDSLSVSSTC